MCRAWRFFLISLLVLYTFGGIASLTYQVVLQRKLTQLIGIDVYSVTLIVFLYMLGIGLGALAGKKIARTEFHTQLLQIAIMQVFLGVTAYLAYHLVSILGYVAPGAGLPDWFYYTVLSLPILVPTTIMGALTPLMVATLSGFNRYGVSVGLSYGMNVAGAALGALGSGLYLIGTYGLHNTLAGMALLDVAVGLAVYLLVRNRLPEGVGLAKAARGIAGYVRIGASSLDEAAGGHVRARSLSVPVTSAAFFAVGFAALGYEIFAFRLLGTVFGNSPYLFPILLFCYLLQLSIGTIIGGAISRYVRITYSYPVICALLLAFTFATLNIHRLLPQDTDFLTLSGLYSNYRNLLLPIAASIGITFLALIPVLLLSTFMPIFLDHARETSPHVDFGFAYFWQTAGNIAGVIVTGVVLFDWLSLPQVNMAMVMLAILGSLVIFMQLQGAMSGRSKLVVSCVLTTVAVLFVGLSYPKDFYKRITYHLVQGVFVEPVKVYEDGQSLSLLYPKIVNSTAEYALMANGKFYVTGILSEIEEGSTNYLPASFAGLAFALNPSIGQALFIGGAHFGEQLYSEHKGATITIVDINSHVFEATMDYGVAEARAQIADNETHVIDGRRFIGSTDKTYDYIHVGIDKATTAGAGNVFSGDFFEVIKDRMSGDGIATFYAYPTVVKAAMGVFADVVVVGSRDGNAIAAASNAPLSPSAIAQARAFVASTTNEERAGDHFVFRNVVPHFLYDREDLTEILRDIEESTDDNLATEYILNREVEVFPGAHTANNPVDIRVWPANAVELSRLRQQPVGRGVQVVDADGGRDVVRMPFVLKRGGGKDEVSSGRLQEDGSIELDLNAGYQIEWPGLVKTTEAQWEVLRGYRKDSLEPLNILLRGSIEGRGLVGIKLFCGDTYLGAAFSYAERFELPLVGLDGERCDNTVIHVSTDTMPGYGEEVRFHLHDLVMSEE